MDWTQLPSFARLRPWLYALTPLALLLGWWLCSRTPGFHSPVATIDRETAIAKANTFLRQLGVDPMDSAASVGAEGDWGALYFIATEYAAGRKPSSAVLIGRVKVSYANENSIELDPHGRVIGFDLAKSNEVVQVERARALFLGQFPAGSQPAPDQFDLTTRSLKWRTRSYSKPFETRQKPLTELAKLILFSAAIYGLRLFARRRKEGELPIQRALLLLLLMTIVGAISFVLDSDRLADNTSSFSFAKLPAMLLFGLAGAGLYAAAGALLGGSYAATEGELREGYPDKLLALDAILSGRLLAKPVGFAVLDGMVIGVFCFLLLILVVALTGQWLGAIAGSQVERLWSRLPVLSHLASIPLTSVWAFISGLLIPLAFLHRNPRSRRFGWVVITVVPFVVYAGLNDHSMLTGATVASSLLWTAALLLAFHASGVAGAVVSTGVYLTLTENAALSVLHPQHSLTTAALIVGCAALPFIYAAWRGEPVEDDEVQPQYAARLTQRMALRAKVEAAREAQSRMIPTALPKIPGMCLAANCYPAGQAGGDFYDFFPLDRGRFAVLLTSGAGPGLPAALLIALAKGYFSCVSTQIAHPAEAVQSFLDEFSHLVISASPEAGLVLVFIDPSNGNVQAARLGCFPTLWRLLDGSVEPVPFQKDPLAVVSQSFFLAPGELLFLHSRGMNEMLGDYSTKGVQAWIERNSKRLAGTAAQKNLSLLQQVWGKKRTGPPADLCVDLTTLALVREHQA